MIGVVVERLVIRFLYGRMIDTMLATWGLSLLLIGFVTTIFGNTTAGISAPLGSFAIGAYRDQRLQAVPDRRRRRAARWRSTLVLRCTAARPDRARHDAERRHGGGARRQPARVYAVTFGVGAALSRPRRRLLAPLTGVVPTIGVAYIAKAFITVISGGAAILSRHAVGVARCSAPSTSSPPSPPRRCSARWRCWSRPSSCCACCRRASPAASSGEAL